MELTEDRVNWRAFILAMLNFLVGSATRALVRQSVSQLLTYIECPASNGNHMKHI